MYVFHDEHDKPPSTQTQLGASLIAGFTATACSLPFDLLKSRMRKYFVVFLVEFHVTCDSYLIFFTLIRVSCILLGSSPPLPRIPLHSLIPHIPFIPMIK